MIEKKSSPTSGPSEGKNYVKQAALRKRQAVPGDQRREVGGTNIGQSMFNQSVDYQKLLSNQNKLTRKSIIKQPLEINKRDFYS